jgi:twitching motility protein PilT
LKLTAAELAAAPSNMLAHKLFPLLAKPEVQELILLTGKPPCAVVNGTYRRLSAQVLQDEDIMAVIMAARGQEHAATLADGAQWDFEAQGVGAVTVAARYDGPLIRVSLRLATAFSAQDVPAQGRAAAPRVAAEPAEPPRRPARSAESSSAHRAVSPMERAARPRSSGSSQQIAAQGGGPQGLELESVAPVARQRPAPQKVARYEPHDPSLRNDPLAKQEGFGPRSQPDALAPTERHEAPELLARGLDLPTGSPDAEPELELSPVAPVVKARHHATPADALEVLFSRARELNASDLHVLADRPATLRIAGDLVPQPEQFDPNTLEQLLLSRVPERMRAVLERDGSCDFALAHPELGRFRANVGRQRTGLKLTARPIGEHIPSLAELGLPESITGALEHHQGLIVITGPTGHGKTTTLAALVAILNRETSHHVITVEDPIEYTHGTARAVVSQREVGTHTKSFSAALKGSLREDPDVIVVGELRDTETVRMALSASETGHLVISTMNTPSAAKAIERLIDLFPPGDQPQVRMTLAGGLRLIISQRLVPSADRKQLVAAAEVLPGSTPLWSLIRENRTFQIASLQQRGKSIGITRLDDSLADLVRSGKTTMEIAREYADSTELLQTLVQGRAVPVRADAAAQTPENQNDPESLQKRGVELGKQVLSRAGKLFGGEK